MTLVERPFTETSKKRYQIGSRAHYCRVTDRWHANRRVNLYTVGQIVLKLVDPCIELKKYIAEIGSDLTLYEEHPRAEDNPPVEDLS